MSESMLPMFCSIPVQLAASSVPSIVGRNSARNIVAMAIAIINPIIMSMVLPSVPFRVTCILLYVLF